MLGLTKAASGGSQQVNSHMGVQGFNYGISKVHDQVIKGASKLPGTVKSQDVHKAKHVLELAEEEYNQAERLSEILQELSAVAVKRKDLEAKHVQSSMKHNQKSIDIDDKHIRKVLADQALAGEKVAGLQGHAKAFNDKFSRNTAAIAQRIRAL